MSEIAIQEQTNVVGQNRTRTEISGLIFLENLIERPFMKSKRELVKVMNNLPFTLCHFSCYVLNETFQSNPYH
jgi:hypothetical protein